MPRDRQRAVLAPMIAICRSHAKVPSPHMRRTIEGILWRHQNGVKWRSVPAGFGPWSMAAQTLIRQWAGVISKAWGASNIYAKGEPLGEHVTRHD